MTPFAALDQNLVALLGTIVATSVFTIGFLAHRTHMTLAEARRRVREHPEVRDKEAQLVKDVGSDLILGINGLLALSVLVIAVLVLTTKDGLATEEKTAVAGFALVEVVVVVVGALDQKGAYGKL
jgi:hypothetical protein